jgi:hypothetical protein
MSLFLRSEIVAIDQNGHGAMFGRSKAALSQKFRAIQHALGAAVLAAGVTMFLTLTAGMAQACPPGKDAGGPVRVVHQPKRAVAVMSTPFIPALAKDISLAAGQCCGGGAHSHGVGCASGCCFACSAATDVTHSGLVLPDGSIRHGVPDESGAVSMKPPPDFRPPRLFA